MKIKDIREKLGGSAQCAGDGEREITEAIAGDLLSFIMGEAREGSLWVTIQAHLNVAAVAVLKDIPLIVVAAGRRAPDDLVERCKAERIEIISVGDSLFETCAKLSALGIKG